MRALITGVVLTGGVLTACTSGTSCGTARYSADSPPASVVARRNVPVWPTAPTTAAPAPMIAYAAPAPTYVPPRTTAPQPIVLSSRATPSPAVTSRPEPMRVAPSLPPPASRARTAAEFAAALRPINATCPVMLGTPVDPSVTASYEGRVVAFSDAKSRAAWLSEPELYTRNLPGTTGFGSASDGPVFASTYAPTNVPTFAPTYVPAPAPPPAPALRTAFAPASPTAVSTYAPSAPAAVLAPAQAPARPVAATVGAATPAPARPADAAAPEDDGAGGVCADGECKGGNCALPPRRK